MGRTEYWNDPQAPKPNSLVPACGVLATDAEGRMLMQRRRDTGQWAIPMGKMELGETPSQCAIRETREETGVLTEITGILGIYSDPGHIVAYTDGEIRQEYEVILLGRPVSGTPAAKPWCCQRHGAGGGVGSLTVQLARRAGVTVIASPTHLGQVRR
jgi:8-oxo-dGTP pyrophosphatase MutT (NUDIX family)